MDRVHINSVKYKLSMFTMSNILFHCGYIFQRFPNIFRVFFDILSDSPINSGLRSAAATHSFCKAFIKVKCVAHQRSKAKFSVAVSRFAVVVLAS